MPGAVTTGRKAPSPSGKRRKYISDDYKNDRPKRPSGFPDRVPHRGFLENKSNENFSTGQPFRPNPKAKRSSKLEKRLCNDKPFSSGKETHFGKGRIRLPYLYIEKPPAAALLPRHRASSAGCRNRSPTGHRTATLPTRRCGRIEKQGPVAPRNRLCRQAAVPTASSAFEASSECPARCGKPADQPFPQRAFGENFPAGIGSRRMRRISIVFLTNFVTFVSKNWLTPPRTGLPPDIRYSFRRDSCLEESAATMRTRLPPNIRYSFRRDSRLKESAATMRTRLTPDTRCSFRRNNRLEESASANANKATARYSLFFSTR